MLHIRVWVGLSVARGVGSLRERLPHLHENLLGEVPNGSKILRNARQHLYCNLCTDTTQYVHTTKYKPTALCAVQTMVTTPRLLLTRVIQKVKAKYI